MWMRNGNEVLVLSDAKESVATLLHWCAQLNWRPTLAQHGESARDALARVRPEVVLVDVHHPCADSRDFQTQAGEIGACVVILHPDIAHTPATKVLLIGGGHGVSRLEPGGDVLSSCARPRAHFA